MPKSTVQRISTQLDKKIRKFQEDIRVDAKMDLSYTEASSHFRPPLLVMLSSKKKHTR